jgi:hypothetical protein
MKFHAHLFQQEERNPLNKFCINNNNKSNFTQSQILLAGSQLKPLF